MLCLTDTPCRILYVTHTPSLFYCPVAPLPLAAPFWFRPISFFQHPGSLTGSIPTMSGLENKILGWLSSWHTVPYCKQNDEEKNGNLRHTLDRIYLTGISHDHCFKWACITMMIRWCNLPTTAYDLGSIMYPTSGTGHNGRLVYAFVIQQ